MSQKPAPSRPPSAHPICVSCGGVIGVYEPMIVRSPWGDVIETSLAQRGEIENDDECFHPACFPWAPPRRNAASYGGEPGITRDGDPDRRA